MMIEGFNRQLTKMEFRYERIFFQIDKLELEPIFEGIQKCKFYIFLTNVKNVIGFKTTGHPMERGVKTKFQGCKIDSINSIFTRILPVKGRVQHLDALDACL